MSDIRKEGEQSLQGVKDKINSYFKADNSLKVSMYVPSTHKREDGETWVDADGKDWEMKNGVARSISKLQEAKRPWWCPECNKGLNGKADERAYAIFAKCHRCVVKEETDRRIDGSWHLFQRLKMVDNAIAYVNDYLEQFLDVKEGLSNPKNYFVDGRWEEWNIGIDDIKKDLEYEIGRFRERLIELQEIRNAVSRFLEEHESNT